MGKKRYAVGPLIAAIVGNCVIATAKFLAAAFTGSSVMIAEGVHSVVDATNDGLMLIGVRRSGAKPNAQHPFGHGKELYFWSLIVALVIFALGGGVSMYEGIRHVLEPAPLRHPIWNYVVLAISLLADGTTLVIAYRHFKPDKGKRSLWRAIRASKDPTKFTVVLEDGAATMGVVIAAVGLVATHLTGSGVFDGLASIAVGLLLCAVAFVLALESKELLLGEAAAPQVISDLRQTVRGDPDVEDIASLLTMHLGPYDLLLNMDVIFREDLTGNQTVAAIKRIERAIQENHPDVKRIFIEARSLEHPASKVADHSSHQLAATVASPAARSLTNDDT